MAVHLHTKSHPGPLTALRIGLLNNMPDAALRATERQFTTLLRHACGPLDVTLSFLALPGVPRGAAAAAHLAAAYSLPGSLAEHSLDALIVTGAEPMQPRLEQEPYWKELTAVLDWARTHTLSTVWSCLAAHAAVLRMDGIERVRSREKTFGVFDCTAAAGHPLLSGLPSVFPVPHSRWNGLREADLLASGYRVLSKTSGGAVDLFVKQNPEWGKSLFVFFQGHPEYQTDTLLREFRRDVARFCRGERELLPLLPEGYFDPATASELESLWEADGGTRGEHLLADCLSVLHTAHPVNTWHPGAVAIYSNWLRWLAIEKARLAGDQAQAPRAQAQAPPAQDTSPAWGTQDLV